MTIQIQAAHRLLAAFDQVEHVKELGYGKELGIAVKALAPVLKMTSAVLESKVDSGNVSRKYVTFRLTKEDSAQARKNLTAKSGKSVKVKIGAQWQLEDHVVTLGKYGNGDSYFLRFEF